MNAAEIHATQVVATHGRTVAVRAAAKALLAAAHAMNQTFEAGETADSTEAAWIAAREAADAVILEIGSERETRTRSGNQ